MRLVSFLAPDGPARLGLLLGAEPDAPVLDLARARARSGAGQDPGGDAAAAGDMAAFLAQGVPALEGARAVLDRVREGWTNRAERQSLLAGGIVLPRDAVRFLPVVRRPGKVVCVGLNFASHIAEAGAAGQPVPEAPAEPLGFGKVASALAGHGASIVLPRHGRQLDYEVELAFVIGRRCADVAPEAFAEHVAGLTIAVDYSLRDLLFRSGGNPFLAKNFDGFCPLGPALVTLDELGDPDDRELRLWVNGELRQRESMRAALFNCARILSYWSARYTFEPGDVITAGTPAGVGIFSRDPASWLLKPGDVVRAEIDGLGMLETTIVADGRASRAVS